jgi:AmpD protein
MLASEDYENSAHVVIGEDGNRVVMATPDQVTFHSGGSRYRNRNNVNDFAIGVEFQGNTERRDLTPKQI